MGITPTPIATVPTQWMQAVSMASQLGGVKPKAAVRF